MSRIFKITGYIQSIYKDGWDTILTRYTPDPFPRYYRANVGRSPRE